MFLSRLSRLVATALLSLVALAGPACVGVSRSRPATPPGKHQGHGPPPHAPAHGYRAKTAEGVALDYDAALGVYVVVGVHDHFYHEGIYYRFIDGSWSVGLRIDGPWEPAAREKLPPGLRSKHHGKGKQKKHGG